VSRATENERDFATFVGVDLGGGRSRNTAVARLVNDADGLRVVHVGTRTPEGQPFYDAVLLEYIRQHGQGALLAVDAPLLPSVCVRCRLDRCLTLEACDDPVVRWFREQGDRLVPTRNRRNGKPATTAYTQRACEVVLHRKHGILPRETLGQGMGPLTARAHYLRRALEGGFELNRNLIEVYPKATIHVLMGAERARGYKREVNTWRIRAEILEELSHTLQFRVWREGCLQNDHCFDAVICAYTGYLWATRGWTLPEEHREVFEQDGWIWFPPDAEKGVD
jgi:predicted nuclease with RNAse H fold